MVEEIKQEEKKEEKIENIKEKVEEGEKKEKADKIAKVYGRDLSISTKNAVAICRFIKGKTIEEATNILEKVIMKKIPVPMKGELPYRKHGIKGRYPIKACKVFIKLLKSLNANCSLNGIEEAYIAVSKADKASQPHRRFGSSRFKRTHVFLVAKESKKEEK